MLLRGPSAMAVGWGVCDRVHQGQGDKLHRAGILLQDLEG